MWRKIFDASLRSSESINAREGIKTQNSHDSPPCRVRGSESINAREGIKTHYFATLAAVPSFDRMSESINAREGIKTEVPAIPAEIHSESQNQ